MSDRKITVGSVCFIVDESVNKVLMLHRSREPMKGMQTGVGGKTNFDEDIFSSCIREIKEETGFEAKKLVLKGVLKTLLAGGDSSWILFVYVCTDYSGELGHCPEGILNWVDMTKLPDLNLIGFLREIMPYVFSENAFFEGTITHDSQGIVIEKKLSFK
jgi:8-oxo-dGTP diphosphatase